MRRVLVGAVCLWISTSHLPAQNEKRDEPGEESLTPRRFNEVHAPLYKSPKSNRAGALTERLLENQPASEPGQATPIEGRNFIDDFILDKIERDGIPYARLTTDREFLRRVTLDLTGRISSPQEIRSFLADENPDKRLKLIDRLLNSEAYVEKWAYFFMDLFRANGKMGRGRHLFHYWMKENLRADRPYDEVVRAMITASAKSNHVVAAANVIAREHIQGQPQPKDGDDLGMVHQLDTDDELSIIYAKAFLGINLSCISCHDGQGHLEKVNVWLSGKTREQFFQNAAFLGHMRYLMYWENGEPQSGEFLIDDGNSGYDTRGHSMIRMPRGGGSSEPAFILNGEGARAGQDFRDSFASMLTAHPQFARATVNLFWSKLMGVGIVDPHDEFDLARQDPGNLPAGWQLQPSHPQLLDVLAKDFRESGYSLRRLMARICRSSAYQLSARFPGEWKDSYTKYFARKFARRLTAEELHDSIVLATKRPADFEFGDRRVGLAMQLSGPSGDDDTRHFMRIFGQSDRQSPPRAVAGSMQHPLLLMQSPLVNDRVLAHKDSRVQELLDRYPDNPRVVEELFLATLSRPPSNREKEVALVALRENRTVGAQNLQWALINNVEFFFNY